MYGTLSKPAYAGYGVCRYRPRGGATLLFLTAMPKRRGEDEVVPFGTVERGNSYAKEAF